MAGGRYNPKRIFRAMCGGERGAVVYVSLNLSRQTPDKQVLIAHLQEGTSNL
jgi:hypothetical protein